MNRDRDKAHFNDDLKSKIISIGFVVGCGFLVNSCCVLLCPQPAQAQVTYQKIQQGDSPSERLRQRIKSPTSSSISSKKPAAPRSGRY